MLKKRSTKDKVSDIAFQLAIYKDLHKQASESRDFWKSKEDWALNLVKVTQNKLRDEKELCDQLAECLSFIVKNYQHLTPADIKRGRFLTQIYKEARNAE